MISSQDLDIQSPLQRRILIMLRQQESCTYTQLKPSGVEGNGFNYHLRTLQKRKLIELFNGSYRLSNAGIMLTDTFSLEKKRVQPRPYFYTYLFAIHEDFVLVYTPKRAPARGIAILPSGKLHYGDTWLKSASREALRRGLNSINEVQLHASINVRYTQNDELISQKPGVIMKLEVPEMVELQETESGRSDWVSLDDINQKPEYFYVKQMLDASHEQSELIIPC